MLRIGTVVVGVNDMRRAVRFWEQALGYVPRDEVQDDWAVLIPGDGGPGTHLALQLSETPVQEHPRIHLDLYTEHQADEVERLKGLGATEVHWDKRPPDADYVIMADPEGNRFCVIDLAR